jgi:hypothetical protein
VRHWLPLHPGHPPSVIDQQLYILLWKLPLR